MTKTITLGKGIVYMGTMRDDCTTGKMIEIGTCEGGTFTYEEDEDELHNEDTATAKAS